MPGAKTYEPSALSVRTPPPATVNGTPILETNLSASRDFSGEGDSSQSNRLVGNITVTEVKVSPDLSEARVYVVPFGGGRSAAESEEIIAGLTHAAGFLRGAVGRALGLRHAPRLQFVLDEQIDRAANLSRLIDSAVDEDRQSHPRDDTEPV